MLFIIFIYWYVYGVGVILVGEFLCFVYLFYYWKRNGEEFREYIELGGFIEEMGVGFLGRNYLW